MYDHKLSYSYIFIRFGKTTGDREPLDIQDLKILKESGSKGVGRFLRCGGWVLRQRTVRQKQKRKTGPKRTKKGKGGKRMKNTKSYKQETKDKAQEARHRN